MPRLILASLLVAYLPGALAFRLPIGRRELRARLAADERVFWAILLSLAWSLAVVLVLASDGRYQFERLLTVNAVVSAAMLLIWRRRLLYGGSARRPSWTDAVPVGIVCLGLWLYFPPSEVVTGGRDPGTYMNEGIQIAQRGGLVIHDQVVESVPAPFRDLFFPSHRVPWYYGIRFMGFFIQDPDRGTVVGQFPHLYPAAIAVGYGLNGLSGARQTSGVLAILGLLAVYFVAARLIGRLGAALAVLLLAINVIVVWFARYPNSEVLTQAFLFAAVLAHSRAREGSLLFFGTLAGALVSLMLFARYDAVLAIAAVSAATSLCAFQRERVGWGFGLALAAVAAAALRYLADPMEPYSFRMFGYTRDQGGWVLVSAAIAALVVVRYSARRERWADFVRRALPPALAAGVVALAVYAYFFRQPGGRLAPADAMAFRTFAWYLGPWGLAGAVAGVALLIRRAFWRDPAFVLTVTAYAVFFFYKTRIVPEHFWTGRRFLGAILPGAMIGITGLAVTLLGPEMLARLRGRRPETASGSAGRSPWLGVAAAVLTVAALVPLAIRFARASDAVVRHVEYAGVIPQLERLAERIGDRDLTLVESRNASDTHVLALPLAYIYARNVLVFANPTPDKDALETFVEWARTRYKNVLFLGEGGTDLLTRRLAAVPLHDMRFEIPEYESALNAYPSGARLKKFAPGLYRLVPRPDAAPGPVVIDIGDMDDLHVLRFHAKETRGADKRPFRWSRDVSYVSILWKDPDAREITIWMGTGGRPPEAEPAIVEVSLDEHVLGTVEPVDELRPYAFGVPADLAARAAAARGTVRLRLRSTTWKPSEVLGGSDDRDLGVVVTRVEVR